MSKEEKELLDLMNLYRCIHDQPYVYYSRKIAEMAQLAADDWYSKKDPRVKWGSVHTTNQWRNFDDEATLSGMSSQRYHGENGSGAGSFTAATVGWYGEISTTKGWPEKGGECGVECYDRLEKNPPPRNEILEGEKAGVKL